MIARGELKKGDTVYYRYPNAEGTWRNGQITGLRKDVALITFIPDGGGFIPDLNMPYERLYWFRPLED